VRAITRKINVVSATSPNRDSLSFFMTGFYHKNPPPSFHVRRGAACCALSIGQGKPCPYMNPPESPFTKGGLEYGFPAGIPFDTARKEPDTK
jgi:hypothetical protein